METNWITIKNQNNGQDVKIWLGNKAEYKSITHSKDTIYHITDENVVGGGGAGIASIVEVYGNSASGYRLWSDGYCEQWGIVSTVPGSSCVITYFKPFTDTNYTIFGTVYNPNSKLTYNTGYTFYEVSGGSMAYPGYMVIVNKTTSNVQVAAGDGDMLWSAVSANVIWKASGYIS